MPDFHARNPAERSALAARHASIVGCGSIGSAMADMLARAGIGSLTLVDPDVLAVENLGRHVLTRADLGRPKVDALRDRLLAINPDLRIETRQERFTDASGLLISCVDSYECESLINAASLASGSPAAYIGVYGAVRAGEIFYCIPGKTACLECFAQFRKRQDIRIDPEKYTDPDFDPTRIPGQPGLWGSVLLVAGAAFQVVLGLLGAREILDCEHPLWLMNLDFPGFQPYALTLGKVAKGCAVCDESKIAELSVDFGA